MSQLKQVLMSRDGLTSDEADDVIHEMKNRVNHFGEDPEEVLYDEGLEPDYVFDLLD